MSIADVKAAARMIQNPEILTKEEERLLQHTSMWGSDSFPVVKRGRSWWVGSFMSFSGYPCPFKTKRAAFEAYETHLAYLRTKTKVTR